MIRVSGDSPEGRSKPDEEKTPPPTRPRRLPPNRQRSNKGSAVRVSTSNQSDDVRAMKEQQNSTSLECKARQKAAEDSATRLAQQASLEDSQYDSSRWEQLVSKQEELMSQHEGDSKPSSSSSRRKRQTTSSDDDMPTPVPSLSRTQPPPDILPGAFRYRPSLGATPAMGLEEGDSGVDPFLHQDSRRSVQSRKEETTTRGDAEDILIEAVLVSGDDTEMPSSSTSTSNSSRRQECQSPSIYPEPELVVGEPMTIMMDGEKPTLLKEEDKARSKKLRWILMAVLFLIVFVIVLASILGVRAGKSSDADNANSNIELPTMAPTAFTQSVLPVHTQSALQDPNTPQSQAYEWLEADLLQENTNQSMHTYFPLQRFALATLFYSLKGSDWKANSRWLQQGTDPCDWYTTFYGVICTNARRNLRAELEPRRHYQRLSLFQNNLMGTLPREVGLLSRLDVVDLHGNAISGTVPSELGLWQDVTLFQIFNNSLTGSLPPQLGQLSQIRHLNFAFNKLTGTIPTELAQLSSTMEVFSVSNNQVEGTIPSQFGLLTNLLGLHLYGNPNLGGPLPSELAQLSQLQKLHLNGIANLTGTVPTQLGGLAKLQELQLEDTKIKGPIPSELGSLSQLTKLTLHSTDLTGSLPPQLCALVQAGILGTLSVDCEKIQCPAACQCKCHDAFPARDGSEIASPQQETVVEAITDPPITVNGQVGRTPTDPPADPEIQQTSAAVGAAAPRPRPDNR